MNSMLIQVQKTCTFKLKQNLQINGSECSFIFGMGKKLIPISKTLEAGTFNCALRRIDRITHVEWANLHVDAKIENQVCFIPFSTQITVEVAGRCFTVHPCNVQF